MLEPEIIQGDRRKDRRYELELKLTYTYRHNSETGAGSGCTVDLSRGGILFLCETPPPVGSTADLHIDWPYLLQGVCPLELVVNGTVTKVSGNTAVVVVNKIDFRTRGERSFHSEPPTAARVSVMA